MYIFFLPALANNFAQALIHPDTVIKKKYKFPRLIVSNKQN